MTPKSTATPARKVRKAGKPPITRAHYDLILDSHREDLGNNSAAARKAKVSVSVATRAYRYGYGTQMPAIRKVMTEDMVEARAKLAELASEVDPAKIAKTRQDVASSRAAQAQALRLTRSNGIGAMVIGASLLRTGASLVKRIDGLMTAVHTEGPKKGTLKWVPTPAEALHVLKQITEVARMGTEMNLATEEAEKRVLGAPDVVIAHTNLTVDQAVATLATSKRMYDRLRRRAATGDLPTEITPAVRLALVSAEKDSNIH